LAPTPSSEVDEAHAFKNLPFVSKLDRVKGLPNPTECQRASDMFLKTQWLLERGGGIVFATGTPIANTIAESWTMARYLMREKLAELGLHHFDAWAKLFADEIVNLYPGAWRSALVISIEESTDWSSATDTRAG
jgi:N12 class adenine-specific DNA methylase